MKKILAIILSIAMLFGVLAINSFADDSAPKVTLITNEGSPVATGVSTYLTLRFDNFESIKGMDVIISSPAAVFGKVNITGFDFKLVKEGDEGATDSNINYTEVNADGKHEIRIVDLTGGKTKGTISFQATAPQKTTEITVTGKYAKDGKTLFSITTEAGNFEVKTTAAASGLTSESNNGNVTENKEESTYTIDSNKAKENNVFYPQGSVYKVTTNEDGSTSYDYANKDTSGNFTITDEYKALAYEIPENGITTFGASDELNPTDEDYDIRFGNYSQNNKHADFHGTMVFEGDWLALKNYYIKNGYTVQQLIEVIYKNYDAKIGNKDYVYYKVPTDDGKYTQVNVYKFKQNKYMWKNDNAGILEYAIRITNPADTQTYTAVAYSEYFGEPTISANVKSVKKPAKNSAQ